MYKTFQTLRGRFPTGAFQCSPETMRVLKALHIAMCAVDLAMRPSMVAAELEAEESGTAPRIPDEAIAHSVLRKRARALVQQELRALGGPLADDVDWDIVGSGESLQVVVFAYRVGGKLVRDDGSPFDPDDLGHYPVSAILPQSIRRKA